MRRLGLSKEELQRARERKIEEENKPKEPKFTKGQKIGLFFGGFFGLSVIIALIYIFMIRIPSYEFEINAQVDVQEDMTYEVTGRTTVPSEDVGFYIDGNRYTPEELNEEDGSFRLTSTMGNHEPPTIELTITADDEPVFKDDLTVNYPDEKEVEQTDSEYEKNEPVETKEEEQPENVELDIKKSNSIVAKPGKDDELINSINETIDAYMASRLKTYENSEKNETDLGWIEVIKQISYKGDRVVAVTVDGRYKQLHNWEKDEVVMLSKQLAELAVAGFEGWADLDFQMSFALELHDETGLMRTFNMSSYEPQNTETFEREEDKPRTKREDVKVEEKDEESKEEEKKAEDKKE